MDTRRIRALRASKEQVDPWRPLGTVLEDERSPRGGIVPALTVFLAGAECPFTCVFCDLWRQTLDGPTPPGALPTQLRKALAAHAEHLSPNTAIKLYNASNFFDPRAVPPADEPELLKLLAPFPRVTVECHPRLVGDRCLGFARRLPGRLEVAMGLETVHPEALARLNKGMTLEDFDRAAGILLDRGIGIRVFVLLSPPFVPPERAVEWAVRSACYALERGADRVSLIPVRDGNGALQVLRREGVFAPPTLTQLEETLERCLALGQGITAADLWEAWRFASCRECVEDRLARMARMNLSGKVEPRLPCPACGWS